MKNEKTATKSEISFAKRLFSNKLFLTGVGGLLVFVLMSFVYLYNPKFVPVLFKSTADIVGDTIVGKELAETIDATRDESGATSIRTIFNTNKEENLEKHCEKKEENGQVQEKCYKTYENEEFGYSVELPLDWTENIIENGVIGFSPQDVAEDNLFLVTVSELDLEEEVKNIESFENSEIVKREEVVFNDVNFVKLTERNQTSNNLFYYFLTEKQGKTYILSGDVSKYDENKILQSFSVM